MQGKGAKVDVGMRHDARVVDDDDVGRVANRRGGAADIGEHDLGDQQRLGSDLEHSAQSHRDRCDEENGGDVVEEGRHAAGEGAQNDGEVPHVAARELVGLDGRVLEEARVGEDADHDHHAEQQADRLKVDPRNDGLECRSFVQYYMHPIASVHNE